MMGSGVCTASTPGLLGAVPEVVGAPGPRGAAAVTAFISVHVVPLDAERVLPNHTVLVEDRRITVMGPASQIKVPAGQCASTAGVSISCPA